MLKILKRLRPSLTFLIIIFSLSFSFWGSSQEPPPAPEPGDEEELVVEDPPVEKEKLTERDKYLNKFRSRDNQVTESEELKEKEPPPAPEAGNFASEEMGQDDLGRMQEMMKKFSGEDGDPLDMATLQEKINSGEIKTEDMQKLFEQVSGNNPQMKELMDKAQKAEGQEGNQLGNLMQALNKSKGKDGKGSAAGMMANIRNIIIPLNQLYAGMSEEEAVANFSRQGEGASRYASLFAKNPKLALFVVRVLRHPNALLGMLDILKRPRLYYFAGLMVFTMIFGWLWKRQMNKNNPSLGMAVVGAFTRFGAMVTLRIVIFLAFFYKEASHTLKIFKDTFL